jgi:hypothetical protein
MFIIHDSAVLIIAIYVSKKLTRNMPIAEVVIDVEIEVM